MKCQIRLRMSTHDAHYAGNLVAGGRLMELFGDVATELLIRHDGDEGLFRAYHKVEFLAPVYAGDYLEVEGEITQVGNSSRQMSFVIRKVITPVDPLSVSSAANVLKDPVIVATAEGTCVVSQDKQRGQQ